MKKIIFALVAILIVSGGLYLKKNSGNEKNNKSNQAQLQKVKIATIKDAGDTNFFISYAKERGFFAKNNIEVEVMELDKTPFDAVVSGNADALFGGISRPLIAYFNGVDSRVLLNGFRPFGVYAAGKFPKGEESKIKKVAINSVKGENQQMAEVILTNMGIDLKQVEFISAPTVASKLSMIQQGLVDLNVFSSRKIFDDNPEFANLTLYGSEMTQKNSPLLRSLVTTQKNIDEKGAQLKAFTTSLQSAIEDAEKNKEAFIQHMMQKYEYSNEQAIDLYEQFLVARKDVNFVPEIEERVLNEAKKDTTNPDRNVNDFVYSKFLK